MILCNDDGFFSEYPEGKYLPMPVMFPPVTQLLPVQGIVYTIHVGLLPGLFSMIHFRFRRMEKQFRKN